MQEEPTKPVQGQQKPEQGIKLEPNKKLEQQLLEMGFEKHLVQQAIIVSNCDKDKAIEYIIGTIEKNQAMIEQKNIIQSTQKKQEQQEDGDFEDVQDDYKMVFLVRMDLKMGLGKMAAQVAHAALRAYKQIQANIDRDQFAQIAYFEWLESGSKKIVLRVDTQKSLMELYQKALKNKLNACYIRDAGLTQIQPGSVTVAALGPASSSQLDKITKHLKLL